MSEPMKKDPMIKIASVYEGQNSKGGDRTALTFTSDQVEILVQELQAAVENSPKGKAKLDIHITDRTTEDGSRTFRGGFAFVRPVQLAPGEAGGAAKPAGRFVPKTDSKKSLKA
jgi:hypothetical protein